jgi:hypothetical protein
MRRIKQLKLNLQPKEIIPDTGDFVRDMEIYNASLKENPKFINLKSGLADHQSPRG